MSLSTRRSDESEKENANPVSMFFPQRAWLVVGLAGLLTLLPGGCAQVTEKEACADNSDCENGTCVAGFCRANEVSDLADRRGERDTGLGIDWPAEDDPGGPHLDLLEDSGSSDLHGDEELLAFGEPCRWDDECEGGYCLWPDDTIGACSRTCDGDCPPEYECLPVDIGEQSIDLCVLAAGGCDSAPVCLPEDVLTETDPCGECGEGTVTRTRTCDPESCTWNEPSVWSECVTNADCSPSGTRTDEQPCGNCGTKSRTGTCNSATCRWNPWPDDYGPCTDQGECSPSDRDRDRCGACHEGVCNEFCEWECSLWGECDWEGGTNWRCCGTDQWQYCLGETYGCVWSDQCVACTGCGCE